MEQPVRESRADRGYVAVAAVPGVDRLELIEHRAQAGGSLRIGGGEVLGDQDVARGLRLEAVRQLTDGLVEREHGADILRLELRPRDEAVHLAGEAGPAQSCRRRTPLRVILQGEIDLLQAPFGRANRIAEAHGHPDAAAIEQGVEPQAIILALVGYGHRLADAVGGAGEIGELDLDVAEHQQRIGEELPVRKRAKQRERLLGMCKPPAVIALAAFDLGLGLQRSGDERGILRPGGQQFSAIR